MAVYGYQVTSSTTMSAVFVYFTELEIYYYYYYDENADKSENTEETLEDEVNENEN